MKQKPVKILLVEGIYDFHFIKNLLREYGIIAEQVSPQKQLHLQNEEHLGIFPVDTKTAVQAILENYLVDGDILQIGIVIDADQSAESTYQSIVDFIAKQNGTAVFPATSPTTGTITTYTRLLQPPLTLGLWIMPDNQNNGFLEHFASELIPTTDQLWPLAQQTITNLPERRYPTSPRDHTRKAELHTWLAWQEEPGKPMGLAVTFGYLKHNTPIAQDFVAWVRALFLTTTPPS